MAAFDPIWERMHVEDLWPGVIVIDQHAGVERTVSRIVFLDPSSTVLECKDGTVLRHRSDDRISVITGYVGEEGAIQL